METTPLLAAGNKHTAVELAKLSPPAQATKKRTELSAIQSAEMATMELAQSAGKTAQVHSETMGPTATSLTLMEEAPALFTSAMIAKSGVHSGILSVEKASTMSHAASAHPIVQRA